MFKKIVKNEFILLGIAFLAMLIVFIRIEIFHAWLDSTSFLTKTFILLTALALIANIWLSYFQNTLFKEENEKAPLRIKLYYYTSIIFFISLIFLAYKSGANLSKPVTAKEIHLMANNQCIVEKLDTVINKDLVVDRRMMLNYKNNCKQLAKGKKADNPEHFNLTFSGEQLVNILIEQKKALEDIDG